MGKKSTAVIAEPPRTLVSHRVCCKWFGITVKTWRNRYEIGLLPIPHMAIGQDLLYDRAVIDHALKTGDWPKGTRFLPRSQTLACADADR